ncbi:hypothetical protein BD626DRAFT_456803 [Schizophyllum amplum]|uniref:F-box domain-containing protein n=1 Tax=Schizophyllum amplum TaxID=97359 RepID=A0A550CF68_9AGAR|nr:hypothetical protein BD626DRAFT_456803 [Auriculariopsis ampla]
MEKATPKTRPSDDPMINHSKRRQVAERLPQELLEEIFAHESTADLKTLSLVCRAWTWSTRRYLFYAFRGLQKEVSSRVQRHFATDDDETRRNIDMFLDFLATRPDIAQQYRMFDVGPRRIVDINYDNALARCLDAMPNIRYLDTHLTTRPYSQALQDAISRALRTSIRSLAMMQDVAAMPIVMQAIRDAHNLQKLRIALPSRFARMVQNEPMTGPRPLLRSLELATPSRELPLWLLSPASPVSLDALKELAFHEITPYVSPVYRSLIDIVGRTIQVLTLASLDQSFSIGSSLFPVLRVLRICDMTLHGVQASDVAELLKQLPLDPAPQLEEIEFAFVPASASFNEARAGLLARDGGPVAWREIQDHLASEDVKGLKKITITILDQPYYPVRKVLRDLASNMPTRNIPAPEQQLASTKARLRELCPKLVDLGLLKV